MEFGFKETKEFLVEDVDSEAFYNIFNQENKSGVPYTKENGFILKEVNIIDECGVHMLVILTNKNDKESAKIVCHKNGGFTIKCKKIKVSLGILFLY